MEEWKKRVSQMEAKLDLILREINEVKTTESNERIDREEPFDLREVILVLWSGRILIFAVTFLSAVLSAGLALSLKNMYRSEVLLAPVDEAKGGAARLMGEFGGLASLAGVNFGGGGDKANLAIEILKSRDFILKFMRNHDLFPAVLFAKAWDSKDNRLVLDQGVYAEAQKKLSGGGFAISEQEALERFYDLLKVVKNEETGFVSVSFEFYSPFFAEEVVRKLVEDTNENVRRRDVVEAEQNIKYLNLQLEQTSISEMRSIFYELIEEQTKTVMFASVRHEYAFKVIDPPLVMEKKSRPNRSLICLLITVFGSMMSAVFVVAKHYLESDASLSKI